MINNRLSYLFDVYTNKQATASEKEEFLNMLANEQYEENLHKLIQEKWNGFNPSQNIYTPAQSEELLKNILNKIHGGKVIAMQPKKKNLGWRQIAAASVIFFILASVGGYFYKTKFATEKPSIDNIAKRYKNDVLPGGNKATLTLSNGSVIILDSANVGTLATQGNVQIKKLANGEIVYTMDGKPATEMLYNTMTTPRGGKYELVLPDGSKVWLNAASSITYPIVFIGKERNVKITGEAYFEVAHNASMPFKVAVANEAAVEVLGTHFNIKAYVDEPSIKTTLLEGSVKMSANSGANNQPPTILQPGQQAVLNNNSSTVHLNKDVDLDETMAWKNGSFSFKEASITTIMQQISRWYDVDITYEGKISDTFVADISQQEPISRLLKLLEMTDRVHFRIEGKKVIVTP